MLKHRRMYCPNCKREWIEPTYLVNSSPLTITGNKRNDLCPICGGPDIEFVEYTPAFLGGDIPRPDSDSMPQGALDLGDNVKEIPRPVTVGFIQNNLISMLIEEKK